MLTGVGLNLTDNTPKLPADQQALYVRRGLFEFNPARHDPRRRRRCSATRSPGTASPRSRTRSRLLCRQPATARFISRKLATYFVADDPPAALVERMTQHLSEDRRLDRRGAARHVPGSRVLAALERAVAEAARSSRTRCSSSCRRCGSPTTARRITNYRPAVGWLQQLGEPLYGRVTPDGYPLTEAAWTSSGQLVRRFEIARAIGSGNAGLFNTDDNTPGPAIGFPMLTSRLFYDTIEPALGARTRDALGRTSSQQEWNTSCCRRRTGCSGKSRKDDHDPVTSRPAEAGAGRRRASAAADPRHRVAGVRRARRRATRSSCWCFCAAATTPPTS